MVSHLGLDYLQAGRGWEGGEGGVGCVSGSQPLLTPLLEVWGPSQAVLPQIEAS